MREINKKKNRVYAQVKNQLLEKLKREKFYKFTYAYSSYYNTWSYDSYPKRARKETKKKYRVGVYYHIRVKGSFGGIRKPWLFCRKKSLLTLKINWNLKRNRKRWEKNIDIIIDEMWWKNHMKILNKYFEKGINS